MRRVPIPPIQHAWALPPPRVQEWCRANGAECLAVQPPGRNMRGKEAPLTTCQALAAALLPVVASRLLEAPYVVRSSSSQQSCSCWRWFCIASQVAGMCCCMLNDHAALRRLWRTAWAPGTLTSSCAWRSSRACPCRSKPSCQVSAAAVEARQALWHIHSQLQALLHTCHPPCLPSKLTIATAARPCSHGFPRHPLGAAPLAAAAGAGGGRLQAGVPRLGCKRTGLLCRAVGHLPGGWVGGWVGGWLVGWLVRWVWAAGGCGCPCWHTACCFQGRSP